MTSPPLAPAELDAIEAQLDDPIYDHWDQSEFRANASANVRRLVAEVRRLRETCPRIVAVLGGDDWTDASVSHIRVPVGLDLKAAEKEWDALRKLHGDQYSEFRRWQSDRQAAGKMTSAQYNAAVTEWMAAHPRPPDFDAWLKTNRGAEDITIEEIGED